MRKKSTVKPAVKLVVMIQKKKIFLVCSYEESNPLVVVPNRFLLGFIELLENF